MFFGSIHQVERMDQFICDHERSTYIASCMTAVSFGVIQGPLIELCQRGYPSIKGRTVGAFNLASPGQPRYVRIV